MNQAPTKLIDGDPYNLFKDIAFSLSSEWNNGIIIITNIASKLENPKTLILKDEISIIPCND